MKHAALIAWFLLATSASIAQSPATPAWPDLSFLLGTWVGSGSGNPGLGTGEFTFAPDLQGTVLVRKSFAEYPAAGGKPAFRHEDMMVVYHAPTKQPAAIYFDNEGHVINYRITTGPDSVVFTSDSAAMAPRFRMVYQKLTPDSLGFQFDIAPPGGMFGRYIEAISTRKRG